MNKRTPVILIVVREYLDIMNAKHIFGTSFVAKMFYSEHNESSICVE